MTDKLRIDWSLCRGHGVCTAAFGEQLVRDEWGYPRIANEVLLDAQTSGAARVAAATCPAAALRVERA